MAKLVNVSWRIKSDKAAREAIRKYRQQYGNGPLFRQFVVACGFAGLGAIIMISGKFVF
jgi:hypothetical protein